MPESKVVKTKIIVMGAGAAGVCAALRLADKGYQVLLLDKNTVFSGASGKNPGRFGLGFHYPDAQTAIKILQESIQVQRKYPNYLVGRDKPSTDPLRHGRYFITKDSNTSAADILKTYEKIRKEYTRLVQEDPENEVFGPPEDLYRVLSPSEYEHQVNMNKVAVGIETAEQLFDVQTFMKDLKKELNNNPNITVCEHHEVLHVVRGEREDNRFILSVLDHQTGEMCEFQTEYLVNSTWDQIEALNDQVGIRMVPNSRTNRLKALLVLKLPPALEHAHSMFFCMGPHCMFTNLGNGMGMATYANVTNMGVSSGLNLTKDMNKFLNNEITEAEKTNVADNILEGLASYIPEMNNAKILDVRFGVVQTEGQLSLEELNDPTHAYNLRFNSRVRAEQQGLISNPAEKLFYCVGNGNLVADMVTQQISRSALLEQCIDEMELLLRTQHAHVGSDIKKCIRHFIEYYTPMQEPERFLNAEMLVASIQFKSNMLHALNDALLNERADSFSVRDKSMLLSETEASENAYDIAHKRTVPPLRYFSVLCRGRMSRSPVLDGGCFCPDSSCTLS